MREGLAAVERAQQFNPVNPSLYQREGRLAYLAGDWPRAERAYIEATRLDPEHFGPYLLLARHYKRTGEPEKALPEYRKALALNPLDEKLKREVDEFSAKVESG